MILLVTGDLLLILIHFVCVPHGLLLVYDDSVSAFEEILFVSEDFLGYSTVFVIVYDDFVSVHTGNSCITE